MNGSNTMKRAGAFRGAGFSVRGSGICLTAAAVAFGVLVSNPEPALAKRKIKIKLGTLAPKKSPWYDGLRRIGDRWSKATDGLVTLKIYDSGKVGDEGDMIRRMNYDRLQAATITGVGLQRLTPAAMAWQIPLAIESYEELDYVRDRMGPMVKKELEKAGFVVLHWGDAGWVHMFSKEPARTPEEFAKQKLYIWSEDPDSEAAWKAAGFNAVPLSATEVVPSLQTGLVDWFVTTPLFALSSQWFGLAPNMVQVKWSPLNGATVMSKKAFERIPQEYHEEMLRIAEEEGLRTKLAVRKLDEEAVEVMKENGLNVIEATPELVEIWRTRIKKSYPDVRGKIVPAEYFDEVFRLTAEFRARGK